MSYPHSMRLMRGVAPLFAWYMAMARALMSTSSEKVSRAKSLHTMALTASIRVYDFKKEKPSDVVLKSLQNSEKSKVENAGDSFQMFCRKLGGIMESQDLGKLSQPQMLQVLISQNIRFNGTLINRTLLQAALQVHKVLTPEVMQALAQVQREFGRDIWSSGYNKLGRLLQIAAKTSGNWSKQIPLDSLAEFCVASSLTQLRREKCKATFFSSSCIDTQSDGSGGWVASTCVKYFLVMHLVDMAKKASEKEEATRKDATSTAHTPKTDIYKALLKVAHPLEYDRHVPRTTAQKESEDGEDAADPAKELEEVGSGDLAEEDPLLQIAGSLTKSGKMVVELVRDLTECVYETPLRHLVQEKDPVAKLLDGAKGDKLAKAMRPAVAGLVSGALQSEGGAPPVSIRELVRRESNPDGAHDDAEAAERKSVWAQAQQKRKKTAQLALWSGKTPESLRQLVDKTLFKTHEGKLNEAHRLFILSGDLLDDAKGSWAKPPGIQPASADPIMKFVETYPWKEHDILLFFDGCQKDTRAYFQEKLDEKNLLEFLLIYSKRLRQGRQRKVFCAAQKVETAWMKIFVSKTKMCVKTRDDDYQPPMPKGEKCTTHDLTMIGLPPCSGRPTISQAEKKRIWEDVDEPPKHRSPSVPICWAECKPVQLWETLLACLDVDCVLDLSPGSGCAAAAAMAGGVAYAGVTRAEGHMSWLTNVLDHECLRLIADQESVLHEDNLSELVQKHFDDVLRELNEKELHESDEEDSSDA